MIKNIQNIKVKMFFLFTVITFQVNAQDIIGDWYGVLSYQGTELRLVFHVTSQNGKYTSTMDSPDQGATGIPMDKTTFEKENLTIEADGLQLKYTGVLDLTSKTLSGTFYQQGISLPLVMTKGGEKSSPKSLARINSDDIVLGDWNGLLEISGMELRIVFHIVYSDEQLESTMDSPDQNTYGIQMNETTFEDDTLRIVAQALNAEYIGVLKEAGELLKGSFIQNGISRELILRREIIERDRVIRPQEPKDFPYVQEEVKFENPNGGHSLAGTITIPEDEKFRKDSCPNFRFWPTGQE